MAENNNIPQFVNSDSFMADKNYVKWLSDLKKRFRMSQLKAAVKVNTEMLKFYWSLGEDICEKQTQYRWGAKVIDRLSLDMRSEFPQSEGFSRANLYHIKRWFSFYSSQIEFVYQAGRQLQKVDNANTPIPEILLSVPWRHQTVIVSKCDTINAALFYLNKVVEDNMSRTELEHVVKAQLNEKAMNKKKKLKICDICLLVAMVLVLASSVQMEACGGRGLGDWNFPMLMYLHCILGTGMFVMVIVHLYLHFGKTGWHEKIKRLKSEPTKILCRFFALMLFLSVVAFIVTMARPQYGLVGAIHGKVGFLFILFCIAHTVKRWNRIKGA